MAMWYKASFQADSAVNAPEKPTPESPRPCGGKALSLSKHLAVAGELAPASGGCGYGYASVNVAIC